MYSIEPTSATNSQASKNGEKMRVLIIGGTGLISTGITRSLQQMGADVIHYNRGKSDSMLAGAPQTIIGDRKQFDSFETQIAREEPYDCVIDMVCFLPEEAESAVRAFRGRTNQYIFCSTVDVYTKQPPRLPIVEDTPRTPLPSFPYAYNKAKCEHIFEAAHERDNFPVTIIRPAYTYGEGRGILHTFRFGMYYLHRIRTGQPIVQHGDGLSIWTACHRDDVGRAFANAVGNEATLGKAYHVAGEEWMTWDGYHRTVAAAMDAPDPRIVHVATGALYAALPEEAEWCKENFRYNNIFDNSAAHADLGFEYTIPFEEGVRRCVAWLDERQLINGDDEPVFYAPLIEAINLLSTQLAHELSEAT